MKTLHSFAVANPWPAAYVPPEIPLTPFAAEVIAAEANALAQPCSRPGPHQQPQPTCPPGFRPRYQIDLEGLARNRHAREIYLFLSAKIASPNFDLNRRCLACSRWDDRERIRKQDEGNPIPRPLMIDKPDFFYAPGSEDASHSCAGCWYSHLDEKEDGSETNLSNQTRAELEDKLKVIKRNYQKIRYEYPRNDRLIERTEERIEQLEAAIYGF